MLVTGPTISARFCDYEGKFGSCRILQCLMTPATPSQDMVFCRTGRGLQKRIDAKDLGLNCSVHHWDGAWEIEEFFNTLL